MLACTHFESSTTIFKPCSVAKHTPTCTNETITVKHIAQQRLPKYCDAIYECIEIVTKRVFNQIHTIVRMVSVIVYVEYGI